MDAVLTQELNQDLQTVVTDADELPKATASQTGERFEKIRTRAEESLRASASSRRAPSSARRRALPPTPSTTRCAGIPTPRQASTRASDFCLVF